MTEPKSNLKSEYYHLTDDHAVYTASRKNVDVKENARKFCKKLCKLGFSADEVVEGGVSFAKSFSHRLPTFLFHYDIPTTEVRIAVRITLRGHNSVNFTIYNNRYVLTEEIEESDMGATMLHLLEASYGRYDYTADGEITTYEIKGDKDFDQQFDFAWGLYINEVTEEVNRIADLYTSKINQFTKLAQELKVLEHTQTLALIDC